MSEVKTKSPPLLDLQLCFALYSTSRAITKVYSELLEDFGLTYPQYLAMLVLWEKDGLSVQEIADRLRMEGATATPLIQRLERMGLIEKRRSSTDERRMDVLLTHKGRDMSEKVHNMPERLGCALNVNNEKAHQLLEDIIAFRTGFA